MRRNERVERGAAQRTVFERDGFLRPDLRIRDVGSFSGPPPPLERFGRVTPLGNRILRVNSPPDQGSVSAPGSGRGK